MTDITPEQQALINQQIAAAQAAHDAYMQAKATQTPLDQTTVIQMQQQQQVTNMWVQPTTEAGWAADALREEQKRLAAFSQPRTDTTAPSAAFLAIQAQYAQQHNAIVGSSGTLYPVPNDQYGRYYHADTGEVFQANVLTQDQQARLQQGIQSPSPTTSPLQQLMSDPSLTHVAPGVIAGFIAPMIGPQAARDLGTYLASPELRQPYQDWFFGTDRMGYASARTPMDAIFMGRSDSPFALPPGSATERFGFDEYGNILGSGFVNKAVGAYNPKMGAGDYKYVGEFHYIETGETVSRYYERNVGSFIDVSPQGVFTSPKVMGVRSGGSPGSFRETAGYAPAMRAMPETPLGTREGTTIFTENKALGISAPKYGSDTGMRMPFRSVLTSTPEQYKTRVGAYETRLAAYNKEMTAFKAGGSKDMVKYAALQKEYKELGVEQGVLEMQSKYVTSPATKSPFADTSILVQRPGVFGMNIALTAAEFKMTGSLGKLWTNIEQSVAIETTHGWLPSITGTSTKFDGLAEPAKYPILAPVAGAAYFGETIYSDVRENPIQTTGLAALPGAFKMAEWGIGTGIAKATTKTGIVQTAGRALSTPLAADVGKYVIKGALVVPWVYESGKSIIEAPMTPAGKGTAIGHVGYQVGAMGAGEVIFARNIVPAMPENTFAGKTFFKGIRKQGPITSAVDESIVLMARGELRVRGLKDEAGILRDTWTMTKLGRYIEPERKGGIDIFEGVTEVPQEHIPIITEATKGGGFFGASTARSQVAPEMRFEDPRLWEIKLRQSKEFRGADMMSEQFDMLDAARPDIASPIQGGPRVQPDYPISLTSDVDVFKTPELVKTRLMEDPGAMVGFRTPDTIIKTPHPEYPGVMVETVIPGQPRYTTGAKALAEIKAGEVREPFSWKNVWLETKATFTGEKIEKPVTFSDITGIYSHGRLFEVDPHNPPAWHPKLPYETGPRTAGGYPAPNERQPLVFRIFGNPMARGATPSEIIYYGEKGAKEKLGYTLQRSGAAMSDLVGLRENAGGYRTEKDFYRGISQAQQLRTVEAQRIAAGKKPGKGATLSEKQLTKMSGAIDSLLGRDIRYQTTKEADISTTRIRDLMEIGVERMNVGLSLRGEPLGPYETGIRAGPETKPGEPMSASKQAESYFTRFGKTSKRPLGEPKIGEGVDLADIPYQQKSTGSQVEKFLAKQGGSGQTQTMTPKDAIVRDYRNTVKVWASDRIKSENEHAMIIDLETGQIYAENIGIGDNVSFGGMAGQIPSNVPTNARIGLFHTHGDMQYPSLQDLNTFHKISTGEWSNLVGNRNVEIFGIVSPKGSYEIRATELMLGTDVVHKGTIRNIWEDITPSGVEKIKIGSPLSYRPGTLQHPVAPGVMPSIDTGTDRNKDPSVPRGPVAPTLGSVPLARPIFNFPSTPEVTRAKSVASIVGVPSAASIIAAASRTERPSTPAITPMYITPSAPETTPRYPVKPIYDIPSAPELTPPGYPTTPSPEPPAPRYPDPGTPTPPTPLYPEPSTPEPPPPRYPDPGYPDQPTPEYPKPGYPDTPVPPFGGGGWMPDGGGGDGGRWRGERSWTYKNPVGADLLGESRGSLPDFAKMGGIKMKKMKGMKGFKPMRF